MRVQRLSYEGKEKAKGIITLLQKPRQLLLSILIGNECANVSVSAVATALWIILIGPNYGPVVAFVSMVRRTFGSISLKLMYKELAPVTSAAWT